MEQTSENKFRSSKKLKIIASTIMQLLVIACMQFTPVFAEEIGVMPPTGADDDLGGGLDGTGNTGAVGNGFRHIDGGYRCYMEDEHGKIRQTVEPIVCLLPTKLYLFQITISVQGIVIFYLSQVVLSV